MAGFGGMRDHDGTLSFSPRLPPALTQLSFRLAFRGRRLQVEVDHYGATYTVPRATRSRSPTTGTGSRSSPTSR